MQDIAIRIHRSKCARVVRAYRIVNNRDIRPAMKLDGNSSVAVWLLHHYGTVIMSYDMETI